MANVLVLSSLDSHNIGQGWTYATDLKRNENHNVFYLSFQKNREDSENYIIDLQKFSIRTFLFRLQRFFRYKIFIRKRENSIFNFTDHGSYTSAREILQSVPFVPNYIVFSLNYEFLSSSVVRDLYNSTKATLFFMMVDEGLLGGGCHNTFDCDGYMRKCENCPALCSGCDYAAKILNEKRDIFGKLDDFHVVATSFDLEKVKKTSFLKKAKCHRLVMIPETPFKMEKRDARKCLGIGSSDFVIFAGAQSTANKSKGFAYLIEALKIFSQEKRDRHIVLLLIGNNDMPVTSTDSYSVMSLGFVNSETMFRAYYACDFFLSSSIADAGPMMVNFSIACGRPVVAFPIGVALDLVEDNITGYICDYKNSVDMAHCINNMYEMSDEDLKQMNENCKLKCENVKNGQEWHDSVI